MPLKNLKPRTPGTRNAVRASFEEITATKPEKSLLEAKLDSEMGRTWLISHWPIRIGAISEVTSIDRVPAG